MFDPFEMIMVRRALYAAGVLPNHILMRISTDGKREMVYSAETLPNARGETWALRYDDAAQVYLLENKGKKHTVGNLKNEDQTSELLMALRSFIDAARDTYTSDAVVEALRTAIYSRRLLAQAAEEQRLDEDAACRLLEMAVKVFDIGYQMP